MITQLIKFCVVGASGLVVDFSVTYFFKEIARINKYVANSLGFITAASSNYFLNRLWTFSSEDPQIIRQYILFIAIAMIGLAINNGIIYLLHGRRNINFYLAKIFAIGVVTLWNFSMNYYFNFNGDW